MQTSNAVLKAPYWAFQNVFRSSSKRFRKVLQTSKIVAFCERLVDGFCSFIKGFQHCIKTFANRFSTSSKRCLRSQNVTLLEFSKRFQKVFNIGVSATFCKRQTQYLNRSIGTFNTFSEVFNMFSKRFCKVLQASKTVAFNERLVDVFCSFRIRFQHCIKTFANRLNTLSKRCLRLQNVTLLVFSKRFQKGLQYKRFRNVLQTPNAVLNAH